MSKRTFNVIKDLDDIESVYPTTKNYVFTHDDHIPTLLAPLLDQDMIDCLVIQIAPVLLGAGTPLFTQKEAFGFQIEYK